MSRSRLPKLRFPEFRDAGEWEETPLGRLGELISGLTYSPDDVRETGLLVLRSSNVQSGEISLDDCVYVAPGIKGANLSLPNDILICVRNGSAALIGKNALIPEEMPLCTHGAFMTVFRSKSAKFVFQLFQTEKYQRQVAGDLGATINSINGSQLVKYKFVVPKSKEQQIIADCLSSLDELIILEAQKLVTLKAHKKGLMQQLFPRDGETVPKLRFPEFRDKGEWEKNQLGTLSIIVRGGSPRPIEAYLTRDINGLNWLKIGDVDKESKYVTRTEERVKESALSKTRVVNPGDLIMSNSMSFGRPYILKIKSCIHDGWIAVTEISNSIDRDYLYYLILSNESQVYFSNAAAGGGVKNLNADIIKALLVAFPKKPEQQKIADCLTSIDDLITAQTNKLEALKAHKKGLMQQLFPSPEGV